MTDPRFREYRERFGYSHDELAALLTEKLGRKVTTARVQRLERGDKLPKSYEEALGIAPLETAESASTRESDPPRPPNAESVLAPPRAAETPAAGDFASVRDRIAKAYGAIGAGTAMLTQNQGYAVVADTYSRDIADAWVAAAKENANVARIVAFMESGGPVGELVIAHLILVGGFVYVSGRGPALDFLYAGKFESFRRAAAHRLEADDLEQGVNGAAPVGAPGPVGDAPA